MSKGTDTLSVYPDISDYMRRIIQVCVRGVFFIPFLVMAREFLRYVTTSLNISVVPFINVHPDHFADTLSFVISIIFFWIYWEKKPYTELGLKLSWLSIVELFVGFLLIIICSFVVAFLFPVFKSNATISLSVVISQVSIGLLTGVREELLYRRYLYYLLSGNKTISRLALLGSNFLFAVLHNAASAEKLILFAFGILLTICYLKTGQLWLSIGYHAAWNSLVALFFVDNSIYLISCLFLFLSLILIFLYGKLFLGKGILNFG